MEYSKILNLESIGNDEDGFLVPIDKIDIKFDIKRIFYLYNVPQYSSRGAHAYYNTEQILICLAGSLKVKCFNGDEENIYELRSPKKALYIPANIWRETLDHSSNAVLLVMSSKEYDRKDYIKDYNEFLRVVKCI